MKKNKRPGLWKGAAGLLLVILFIFVSVMPVRAAEESSAGQTEEEGPVTEWPKAPDIHAGSAVLLEADSGAILYSLNMHDRHYPASITKILTALIAYENLEPSSMIRLTDEAVYSVPWDGTNIGMDTGEAITLEQALYACLTASANEVSNGMAEAVSGSLSAFAVKMNEKAASLGCEDSNFVNANGLFNENHYSSAYDMAQIARAFFSYDDLCMVSGTVQYHFKATETQPDEFWIRTRHRMLTGEIPYEGIIGGKTGYTDEARNTLVTCARRGDLKLICVVMQEEPGEQFEDTVRLFDYGFDNFVRIPVSDLENGTVNPEAGFMTRGRDVYGSSVTPLSIDADAGVVLPAGADTGSLRSGIVGADTYVNIKKTLQKTNESRLSGITDPDQQKVPGAEKASEEAAMEETATEETGEDETASAVGTGETASAAETAAAPSGIPHEPAASVRTYTMGAVRYRFGDRVVGYADILFQDSSGTEDAQKKGKEEFRTRSMLGDLVHFGSGGTLYLNITGILILILVLAAAAITIIMVLSYRQYKERQRLRRKRRKRKKTGKSGKTGAFALLVLAGLLWYSRPVRAEEALPAHPDYVIAEGVSISGEDVSGMTEKEAMAHIQSFMQKIGERKLILKGIDADDIREVPLQDLGYAWINPGVVDEAGSLGHGKNLLTRFRETEDLKKTPADFRLQYSFEKDAVRAAVEKECTAFDQEVRDGRLEKKEDGVVFVAGQDGYKVDIDASAEKVYEDLTRRWDGLSDETCEVTVAVTPHRGTEEELGDCTDLLGRYTTYFSQGDYARCKNIENGCALASDEILRPGETFSVLEHLVPFSEENGYYYAGSYLNNEVVQSLGGGICQVSTTLYNAVIRSELEVLERRNHSLMVGYVEPSMDAAIAESAGMDMKFTNNLDSPVYIWGQAGGGTITFEIYGKETRSPDREISFYSEVLEWTYPNKVYEPDASRSLGSRSTESGHTGCRARLIKVVKEKGEVVSSEIFNESRYAMTPNKVKIGTGGNSSGDLISAIRSGNEGRISSQINKIKNKKKKQN